MIYYVVALLILTVVVYAAVSYHDLAQMQKDIAAVRQEISNHIVKRHQVLPELLEWCRQRQMDDKLLQDVELAAKKVHRVHHKTSLQDLGTAETELRRQLGALYRVLHADKGLFKDRDLVRHYKRIMELQIIIADRSELYNRLVQENNRRLQRQPDAWLADFCRFEIMECLQFQEEDGYNLEHKGMYA